MTAFNAIVMAAGRGTRMRSGVAKVLHPICGVPMIRWAVDAALEAGADHVVVVRAADVSLDDALPERVAQAVQDPAVHGDGTAGAAAAGLSALEASELPVLVMNGDHPLVTAETLRGLVDAHLASGAPATVAAAVVDDPTGYGRVVRDAAGLVDRIVETKVEADATAEELAIHEVNSGIYCFGASALSDALPKVGSDNGQAERYLPDVLALLRAGGTPAAAEAVTDPSLMVSVNDRAELAAATRFCQRRIIDGHMAAGVTVVSPCTVTIDAGVTIGQDALIEPDVHLRGSTSVAAGARVGPSVTAVDAEIGERASVGPYAYLRPGTVIGAGAKAGTFVELKNTRLGEGAKVPHLSYVGDADVGDHANLGAVTVTANYDGRTKKKSRTTIGSDVKTGVLTALVAPVELGPGAYTAAGTVVTEDVPAGALALSRGRQKNVDGYGSG
ncbi:MAG: bifunctional UDP-N-acetylglucosamine diphosphorylase/glucosamine-1-phosphate N-acetyltransferase GlmU [Baekduia sp.]